MIIVLVGLSDKQIRNLPKDIVGIGVTRNIGELVMLYSLADIVLNLSYAETFGLTTTEGFACGTPGIVYNVTASPELVTPETGIIVEASDVKGVANAITTILNRGKNDYSHACRKRAEDFYDKNKNYQEYLDIYGKNRHNPSLA